MRPLRVRSFKAAALFLRMGQLAKTGLQHSHSKYLSSFQTFHQVLMQFQSVIQHVRQMLAHCTAFRSVCFIYVCLIPMSWLSFLHDGVIKLKILRHSLISNF